VSDFDAETSSEREGEIDTVSLGLRVSDTSSEKEGDVDAVTSRDGVPVIVVVLLSSSDRVTAVTESELESVRVGVIESDEEISSVAEPLTDSVIVGEKDTVAVTDELSLRVSSCVSEVDNDGSVVNDTDSESEGETCCENEALTEKDPETEAVIDIDILTLNDDDRVTENDPLNDEDTSAVGSRDGEVLFERAIGDKDILSVTLSEKDVDAVTDVDMEGSPVSDVVFTSDSLTVQVGEDVFPDMVSSIVGLVESVAVGVLESVTKSDSELVGEYDKVNDADLAEDIVIVPSETLPTGEKENVEE